MIRFSLVFVLILAHGLCASASSSSSQSQSELDQKVCLHPSASTDTTALIGRTTNPEQRKREFTFLKELAGVSDDDSANETSPEQLKSSIDEIKDRLKTEISGYAKLKEKVTHQKPMLEVYYAIRDERPFTDTSLKFITDLLKKKIAKQDSELAPKLSKIADVRHKIKALRESKEWEDRDKADELEENSQESESTISELTAGRKKLSDYLSWIQKGRKGDAPETDLFEGIDTSDSDDLQSQLSSSAESIKSDQQELHSLQAQLNALKPNLSGDKLDQKFRRIERAAAERYGTLSNSGFQFCDLTAAELAALNIYTASGYTDLNTKLRLPSPLPSEYQAFRLVLSSALQKIRPYQGKVVRGTTLTAEVRATMKVGAVIKLQAFTSTSLASAFTGEDQLTIYSKSGRYIAPFSNSYGEEEVLFDAGAQFKVLSKKEDGGTYTWVLQQM